MSNVILFPAFIRINDAWWHGGRSYGDVWQFADSVSDKDYRRMYEWDARRVLGEEYRKVGGSRRGGGSAA